MIIKNDMRLLVFKIKVLKACYKFELTHESCLVEHNPKKGSKKPIVFEAKGRVVL